MTDRKATFAKRQRELEQKDRAAQRLQRKAQRKAQSDARSSNPGAPADPDVDPDLAGIVAGPQPVVDDGYVHPPDLTEAPGTTRPDSA